MAGTFVAGIGIIRVLRIGLLLAAVGLTAMGISSNLVLLILMSVMFVAGISVTVPTMISLVGQIASEARGIAITLYSFVLFIGATLGPIIALHLLGTGSYALTFVSLGAILAMAYGSSHLFQNPIPQKQS